MSGDSQATFSDSVKNAIHSIYKHRCVICLSSFQTTQCAHIIDVATLGQQQLRNAVKLGIISEDYKRNAATNGMVQCANCHALFTMNYLVLSLPIPVLNYLEKYVTDTPEALQQPLYKVFDLLADALEGIPVDLPNPQPILPYIGLFSVVTLDPTKVVEDVIPTLFLPSLSIIRGATFVSAPANTSATDEGVARIFDSLALDHHPPFNYGHIPISPLDPGFKEKRYWRLPVPAATIFTALIARLQFDVSDCAEILITHRIHCHLELQCYGRDAQDNSAGGSGPGGGGGPGSGGGPSVGGGNGGGPSEGGHGQSERKGVGGKGNAGKGKKKPRKVAGGDGAAGCGNSSGTVCSHYGQSEISSSTCALGDDAPEKSIGIDWETSDSKIARSISAIDPPDKDNPDEWRFGPSFSTNKIVFTARAVKLT